MRVLLVSAAVLCLVPLLAQPALAGSVPATSSAAVKQCGQTTVTTNDTPPIVLWRLVRIRAYKISCSRVKSLARRWLSSNEGADQRGYVGGYRCVYQTGARRYYCAKGNSSSFSWALGRA